MEDAPAKVKEGAYALLAFVAGLAIAFTAMLRDFDPQPSNPTISVTNAHFGVATFTVRGDGPSVNRMAAAIACVNGEIPWQLKPLSKLVSDKVAIIRKLEERLRSYEKTSPLHSDMLDPAISTWER